jgi:glycosyltransferase involved in cell wall biosynthesis
MHHLTTQNSPHLKTDVALAEALDIVIPVYNEDIQVVRNIIHSLQMVLSDLKDCRIIVVDDGSAKHYGLDRLAEESGIIFLRHERNKGYGAALKTGILSGQAPWIGIIDADGTYPVDAFPDLIREMRHADMAVGIRTGSLNNYPFMRRLPKYVLNRFASYFAGTRILDLNSGLRVFSRELCHSLWSLFPAGFSFTSTLTMGAIMGGFRIKEHPIPYYKRMGKSTIQPLRDTVRFFYYALRLGLLFYPMKVFGPLSGFIFIAGFSKGILRDYLLLGHVGNLAVTLMIASIQLFMMGLLGELIVHGRSLQGKFFPGAKPDR